MATELPNFSNSTTSAVVGATEEATPRHFVDSYTLHELTIVIKNGTRVSLTDVFVVMEVYEDIFSPSISGFIRIRDYVGGLEKFIFTGGEVITIRALKPNTSEIIVSRDDLVVYEISKVAVEDQNTMTYDLRFTSKSAIESQKKRLYKSFGGNRSITDIVKKLYSSMEINPYLNIPNIGTGLQNTFVSPGYNPIEAITHLAKRASVDGDYYVFFERFNTNKSTDYRHLFMGLSEIKKWWTTSGANIPKILYVPGVVYVTEEGAETNVVATAFQIQENYKHLDYMNGGFYNSRVREINLATRKYGDIKISYKDRALNSDFYQNKFIESGNIFFSYDDVSQIQGERLVVSPTNDSIVNKKQWVANDTYGAILNSSIRILVDIPGGSNKIRSGYAVELDIPSLVAKSLALENSEVQNDRMHSGKYLVTACRHIIDKQRYRKKIELSRGSLQNDIDKLLG
jgi:hypothetical protein